MSLWIYVWLTAIGAYLAAQFFAKRHRESAIRDMAARLNFRYLGNVVPGSLSLATSQLRNVSAIWNVVEGEHKGIRLIAFACRVGYGKGSWRRSVIAAEAATDVFETVAFNRDLALERSGQWILLYEPKVLSLVPRGLMPVSEIEARLDAVS
jgi:hypothetical protein